MKRIIVSLVMLVMLILAPAAPANAEVCTINVQGTVGIVVCAGQVIGQVPLPTVTASGPTVTLPPIPGVTTIIPGPTQTVQVPGPTATVTVPGDSETVTLSGPTVTATVPGRTPQAVPTQTITISPVPDSTVTTTETVNQGSKVDKPDSDSVLFDLPPLTTKQTVGYSLVVLLILCGLIVFGLWLGYVIGYKDSERKEMKFLDALRDQFYTGTHR